MDIGDGQQAHLETLCGLFELTLDGFFFSQGSFQVFPGSQDLKIGVGSAENQELLIGGKL